MLEKISCTRPCLHVLPIKKKLKKSQKNLHGFKKTKIQKGTEANSESNMLDETFGENSLLFSQKSSYVRLTGF